MRGAAKLKQLKRNQTAESDDASNALHVYAVGVDVLMFTRASLPSSLFLLYSNPAVVSNSYGVTTAHALRIEYSDM